MRMRTHIDLVVDPGGEFDRSHMVEEDKRADHAALREWQNAPDLEPAQVTPSLVDHQLDHAISPSALAEIRLQLFRRGLL